MCKGYEFIESLWYKSYERFSLSVREIDAERCAIWSFGHLKFNISYFVCLPLTNLRSDIAPCHCGVAQRICEIIALEVAKWYGTWPENDKMVIMKTNQINLVRYLMITHWFSFLFMPHMIAREITYIAHEYCFNFEFPVWKHTLVGILAWRHPGLRAV